MANGKALVDGITYLANTYCGGSLEKVHANLHVDDNEELTVYLIDEHEKEFTPQDIAFMSGCGFWHHKAGEGFNPTMNYPTDYSWFGISI